MGINNPLLNSLKYLFSKLIDYAVFLNKVAKNR